MKEKVIQVIKKSLKVENNSNKIKSKQIVVKMSEKSKQKNLKF